MASRLDTNTLYTLPSDNEDFWSNPQTKRGTFDKKKWVTINGRAAGINIISAGIDALLGRVSINGKMVLCVIREGVKVIREIVKASNDLMEIILPLFNLGRKVITTGLEVSNFVSGVVSVAAGALTLNPVMLGLGFANFFVASKLNEINNEDQKDKSN